jgi:hypothetical protein
MSSQSFDFHEFALSALSDWISKAKGDRDQISSKSFIDERDGALAYCLERAIDLASGAELAAKRGLIESLSSLTRCLYETFLWTSWIQLSEANAVAYKDVAFREMKKRGRIQLREGLAKVSNKETGEDYSAMILEMIENDPPPPVPSFQTLAEQAGIKSIHLIHYPMLSLEAHGSAYEILGRASDSDAQENIYSHVTFSNAMMQTVAQIVSNWFSWREVTPVAKIYELVGESTESK